MRVDEHRRRTVRDHCPCKLGYGDHAALHVHVRIAQTRHEVAIIGLDNIRLLTDGVTGVGTDVGKSATADGHIGFGNNLA